VRQKYRNLLDASWFGENESAGAWISSCKKASKSPPVGRELMTMEMEEARSRVELAIIKSDHRAHAATCVASEGNRQNDVAQAILAGGGSATIAAVVRTRSLTIGASSLPV
jgi:hypothetical protein